MAIIRTLPGHASSIAYTIDNLNAYEIAGTIAGDDTILALPKSIKKTSTLRRRLAELFEDQALPRLVRVDLQAERAEADAPETTDEASAEQDEDLVATEVDLAIEADPQAARDRMELSLSERKVVAEPNLEGTAALIISQASPFRSSPPSRANSRRS